MRKLLVYLICGVVGALFLANAHMAPASELVYTPINPSFGGSPFNGQWLLDQAQAQNKFTERYEWRREPLEEFQDMLTRQILYRMTTAIINEAFGEYGEALQPGHYEVGNYTIDITTDGVVITVVMVDTVTGNMTTIEVPYYEFSAE